MGIVVKFDCILLKLAWYVLGNAAAHLHSEVIALIRTVLRNSFIICICTRIKQDCYFVERLLSLYTVTTVQLRRGLSSGVGDRSEVSTAPTCTIFVHKESLAVLY